GATKSAPDVLYDRHGSTFDTRGVLAGDEGEEYAKSTDKVWYYGGTNRDDVINVDYVTEPGLLQGHHLITRLTNNNGNYTFAATVRLDFNAVDQQGRLIWNATDFRVRLSELLNADPEARGEATAQPVDQAPLASVFTLPP